MKCITLMLHVLHARFSRSSRDHSLKQGCAEMNVTEMNVMYSNIWKQSICVIVIWSVESVDTHPHHILCNVIIR